MNEEARVQGPTTAEHIFNGGAASMQLPTENFTKKDLTHCTDIRWLL